MLVLLVKLNPASKLLLRGLRNSSAILAMQKIFLIDIDICKSKYTIIMCSVVHSMEREARDEFRGQADGTASDVSVKQAHATGGSSDDGMVPASVMQQILPLQFLHASSASSGTTAASLSWMMSSPYQMMMLPGTQQLILPGTGSGGVLAMHDGQLYVSPIADNAGAADPGR